MSGLILRIEWNAFVEAAMRQLNAEASIPLRFVGEPKFKKDYGYDSIEDMYDFPTFIEVEVELRRI